MNLNLYFLVKLKNLNQKNIYKKPIKKRQASLKRKQIFSFIAGAINHKEVRSEIIATILDNIELGEMKKILKLLKNEDINKNETIDMLKIFDDDIMKYIESNILLDAIYKLFPYSGGNYDPDLALKEIKESIEKFKYKAFKFEKNK